MAHNAALISDSVARQQVPKKSPCQACNMKAAILRLFSDLLTLTRTDSNFIFSLAFLQNELT